MSTLPSVLATDLDGTLIPLDGHQQNPTDLRTLADQLRQSGVLLVFVTGRNFQLVFEASRVHGLPTPDWLICDVGTSIYQRQESGEFAVVEAYAQHQQEIISTLPIEDLKTQLQSISGLRPQPADKQGRFKLSYYVNAARLDELAGRLQQEIDRTAAPYSIVPSIDPFNGDGLIDLLPRRVSKAHALIWWTEYLSRAPETIVFAGDSRNDLAAFTSGLRSIIVSNADRTLARQVYDAHRAEGWSDRLYFARQPATSGVLEGCRWFELLPATDEDVHTERLGATPLSCQQTLFRVWAPRRQRLEVELTNGPAKTRHSLARQENGFFAGRVTTPSPSARYQLVLDQVVTRPDPASRYQPQGVHGDSQIVDPRAFPWSDQAWSGVPTRDLVIYELHVGAFTHPGTFRAAVERLPELVELGVTAVEIMPVAQTPGRWNWGYDGVDLYAVRNTYGQPDDFKAFVDACHQCGLAVLLDVVYNHLGPEGNYLSDFGPYPSSRHHTPWGDALNFDGADARPVRQFVIGNALSWLDEFHLDGLRLDAVHFMRDQSQPHILDELRQAVSRYAQTAGRRLHLIAETNVYDATLLENQPDREPYDAIWCDCLMHSIYAHALPDLQLTDRAYRGAADLVAALESGYVYSGRQQQRSPTPAEGAPSQPRRRGRLESLVVGLQTHDAVGNHPRGSRLHQLASKEFQRAAAALTLLHPGIPLIFMGEESAVDSPFPFFVDFEDARLQQAAEEGRRRDCPQHVWGDVLTPSEPETFLRTKCPDGSAGDASMRAWYRELIALRKQGIADGWLAADRMAVGQHAECDVFWVRFDGKRGGSIHVQVRLSAVDTRSQDAVERPLAGSLLLSSEPTPRIAAGQVLLQPNHAVISAE